MEHVFVAYTVANDGGAFFGVFRNIEDAKTEVNSKFSWTRLEWKDDGDGGLYEQTLNDDIMISREEIK